MLDEGAEMIQSFGNRETESLFHGESVRKLPPELTSIARRKLDFINLVNAVDQLRIPPSNHLEKLRGDLSGFWSIRVNRQYRIIFKWDSGNAHAVQIVDYH